MRRCLGQPSQTRLLLFVAALLGATAPGFSSRRVAADDAAELKLTFSDSGYPVLDPARYAAGTMNDERTLICLLEPPTVLDPETGQPRAGAAERWTQSDDERTWTFHLRKTAKWSDGSPVTSQDFVRSWRRTLDRATDSTKASPWVGLLYVLDGCRETIANAARSELFSQLRARLSEEIGRHQATGIPGHVLHEMLSDLGVRPYLIGVEGRALKIMADLPERAFFSAEQVELARDALREARTKAKQAYEKSLDHFGKAGSGVEPRDDHTLVLRTEGVVAYLPTLMSRGVFAPIHASYATVREKLFDDAHNFRSSGPLHVKGRGPHPRAESPNEPTASLVDLVASPTYDGPNKAKASQIIIYTDQWAHESALKIEDLRMFDVKATDHVFCTWQELPPSDPKKPEMNILAKYEQSPAFRARPTGNVVYLQFRCDRAPFRDRHARQAFAQALDLGKAASMFWPAGEPLDRLVPEGAAARLPGPKAPTLDLAAAKKALAAAKLDPELWVDLSYGSMPRLERVAAAIIATWKKSLGFEAGTRIETTEGELLRTLRMGSYQAILVAVRGWTNDASAYLARFHSSNPEGGVGLRDEVLDALLEGAANPAAARDQGDAFLKRVGGDASIAAALARATTADGRESFRAALLAAAERRLLEEFVIVPVAVLREGELAGRINGFGSDAAWRNPAFVGALWNASK